MNHREYLELHSGSFKHLCPENQEGLVEQLEQGEDPQKVIERSHSWLEQERFESECATLEGEANEYSFYT